MVLALATACAPTPPPAPQARWEPCDLHDDFECSTLRDGKVPAIVHRAQKTRRGVIIVHFGGPGSKGTETLPLAWPALPQQIRDDFDVASFDQLGTSLECGQNQVSSLAAFDWTAPAPGVGMADRWYTEMVSACTDTLLEDAPDGGVGTIAAARDADELRRALDASTVSFLGYSYGTAVGLAYASLFPTYVRSMVLDGPAGDYLDPQGERMTLRQARAFQDAFDEFLRQCGQDPACPFYSAGNPTAAFVALWEKLAAPVRSTVFGPDGQREQVVGRAQLATAVSAALYSQTDGWPVLAKALQSAATGDYQPVVSLYDGYYDVRNVDGHDVYGPQVGSYALTTCADWGEWRTDSLAPERLKVLNLIGPMAGSWAVGNCKGARAEDPIDSLHSATQAPVLIVASMHDPATPADSVEEFSARFDGPHEVLWVQSWGHAMFANDNSRCVDRVVTSFLVQPELTGATCPPSADSKPWTAGIQ